MTILAFSESQAAFLEKMAGARPQLWEYQLRAAILDAHSSGDVSSVLAELNNTRAFLKRGILDLPPQRNLSQYIATDPARILQFHVDTDGKSQPSALAHTGSDPLAWLIAAYENAQELLAVTETLIAVCHDAATTSADQELFKLDPPRIIDDPRVPVIKRFIHHFNLMSAEEVLHVFDARQGVLSMRDKTKWRNAVVVEGVRNGLSLQPSALRLVYVQHADGSTEGWMTDDRQPALNRFGAHVNSARNKGFDGFDTIETEISDLTRSLRLVNSPRARGV